MVVQGKEKVNFLSPFEDLENLYEDFEYKLDRLETKLCRFEDNILMLKCNVNEKIEDLNNEVKLQINCRDTDREKEGITALKNRIEIQIKNIDSKFNDNNIEFIRLESLIKERVQSIQNNVEGIERSETENNKNINMTFKKKIEKLDNKVNMIENKMKMTNGESLKTKAQKYKCKCDM